MKKLITISILVITLMMTACSGEQEQTANDNTEKVEITSEKDENATRDSAQNVEHQQIENSGEQEQVAHDNTEKVERTGEKDGKATRDSSQTVEHQQIENDDVDKIMEKLDIVAGILTLPNGTTYEIPVGETPIIRSQKLIFTNGVEINLSDIKGEGRSDRSSN